MRRIVAKSKLMETLVHNFVCHTLKSNYRVEDPYFHKNESGSKNNREKDNNRDRESYRETDLERDKMICNWVSHTLCSIFKSIGLRN